MCLRTFETKERIAESDIVCYKILSMLDNGRIATPYVGKKVSNKVLCGKRLFKHYFFSIKDIRNVSNFKEIRRGYIHCYASKPTYVMPREIVFKCVIPKGTRYWYDEIYGEYAARKIRFVKEMAKSEIQKICLCV